MLGDAGEYSWPDHLSSDCVVIVDDLTAELAAMLSEVRPRKVFTIAGPAFRSDPSWRVLPLIPGPHDSDSFVKIYVPVHRLATMHRHNGFGFTGYQLILSDRSEPSESPPDAVAWLTAAFTERDVIVVEDGVAAAWKGRALRGRASVDSRMDLWRLVAHADLCIDLAPGEQIARECIEAMRFGTPIAVPADSGPAMSHATLGGGATFGDPDELIKAALLLQCERTRSATSDLSRAYADANFGGPAAFVSTLRTVLSRIEEGREG
jgi:hypothetical protein